MIEENINSRYLPAEIFTIPKEFIKFTEPKLKPIVEIFFRLTFERLILGIYKAAIKLSKQFLQR